MVINQKQQEKDKNWHVLVSHGMTELSYFNMTIKMANACIHF